MCLIIIPVILFFLSPTYGYPKGAPPIACDFVTPNHFPAYSQKKDMPYTIHLGEIKYSNAVNENTTISITISGEYSEVFKGFLILARNVEEVSGSPVGYWESSNENITKVKCNKGGEAMTHKNPESKNRVDLNWKVSKDFKGKIKFIYAIVEKFETFWAGKETEVITINDKIIQATTPSEKVTTQKVEIKTSVTTPLTTEIMTWPEFHTEPTPARNFDVSKNSQELLIVNFTLITCFILILIFL